MGRIKPAPLLTMTQPSDRPRSHVINSVNYTKRGDDTNNRNLFILAIGTF